MRQVQCEECGHLWRKYAQVTMAYIGLASQPDQIATDDPKRPAIFESIVTTTETLDEIRAAIVRHEAQVHGRSVPLGANQRVQGRAKRVRRILNRLGYAGFSP